MCNPTALIEREKLPRLTWRLVWMDPVSAEPVVPWESFIYKNIYNTDNGERNKEYFLTKLKTNDNKLNNLYCIHQYHLTGIQRNSWKSNSNLQLHNLQLLQGTDVDFIKIIYERGSFDLLTSLNWSLSVPTVEVMLSIFTDRLSRDSDGLVWLARPISSIWIFFPRISYIKYRISFSI